MKGTDAPWERFFEATNALAEIEARGFTYITAKALKEKAQWEPRLLAKQDTLEERPAIFSKNHIAIFPVRNGEYILFHDPEGKSYFRFPESDTGLASSAYTSQVRLTEYDTYPSNGISNEMQAIDFAYIGSLLRTVTGQERLDLVLRGRTYSGQFDFVLPEVEHTVQVVSVQIEVDGGYESPKAIYLIEGKLGWRSNFHIRQLYYPWLEWKHRSNKQVVPIFLVYSNSRYYFYEFEFGEKFGEARVERKTCYVLDDAPTPKLRLRDLLRDIQEEAEPVEVPFPQANDLDKVVDALGLMAGGPKTKTELAEAFEFDEKQGDYYANAARYLGLARRTEKGFGLTDAGWRLLAAQKRGERALMLLRQLLARPTFRRAVQQLAEGGSDLWNLTDEAVAAVIGRETALSGSTPLRRASTVRKWIGWMMQNGDWT